MINILKALKTVKGELLVGLVFGVIVALRAGPVAGLVFGLFAGAVLWLVVRFVHGLLGDLAHVSLLGLASGMFFGLILPPVHMALANKLIIGLGSGLILVAACVLCVILYYLGRYLYKRLSRRDRVFRATVSYIHPSYADLKSAFDRVSTEYEYVEFQTIDLCKTIRRETCELNFVYMRMNREANTYDVFAKMNKHGLRPAIYEELIGFAKQYPDEQKKFPIVALGSIWMDPSGFINVARLQEADNKRILKLYLREYGWGKWPADCCFLTLKK